MLVLVTIANGFSVGFSKVWDGLIGRPEFEAWIFLSIPYVVFQFGRSIVWAIKTSKTSKTKEKEILTPTEPYSPARSTAHVVTLMAFSFGLYLFPWLYKNLKQLNESGNVKTSNEWTTVELLIPVWNIWVLYKLFSDIRDASQKESIEVKWSPGWRAFAYALGTGALARWLYSIVLSKNAESAFENLGALIPVAILFGFSLRAVAVVQNTLNEYWKKTQPELREHSQLSDWESVMGIIGAVVWILLIFMCFFSWMF